MLTVIVRDFLFSFFFFFCKQKVCGLMALICYVCGVYMCCVVCVWCDRMSLWMCVCAYTFREGHGGLDHGAVVGGQQDAGSDHPAPQAPPPHQQHQGHQEKSTVRKMTLGPV